MGRRIGYLWLAIVLPFWTLPFIFMTGPGGFRSHLTFHIIYPFVIVAAVWALWRLQQAAPSRALRWLATILIALQAIARRSSRRGVRHRHPRRLLRPGRAVRGQRAHGLRQPRPPSLMLSQMLVVVTTIVWAVQRKRLPAADRDDLGHRTARTAG